MEKEIRTVEINGIKLDVDLRNATKIDEFKIGDNVKVLKNSGSGYDITNGVIIDFVNFKELPTIQIATWKYDYWSSNHIEFINFNSETKDIEISICSEHELQLEKNTVVERMNIEIQKKRDEADDLEKKRDWFVKYFNKYFKS